MENHELENIVLTKDQFNNLIKLSGIEIAADTKENISGLVSRALIALERKLNYFNIPLDMNCEESSNVLIVDDTELSIFQLSVMLQKIGINVYVARTKEDALAEFKKKSFKYLILDLYMPDYTDGFDLIKEANKLRAEEGKEFKIIAISGTDNPEIIQKAYKLEIDEFIPKAIKWHEKVIKFISDSNTKISYDEFSKFNINDNICTLTLYKVNNTKYVDNILKEVNSNVLTGKFNVIFNMEHIKVFSDNFSNLFAEVYKATSLKGGHFVLVKPCQDVVKALEYVFLADAIKTFNSMEEAIQYIEKKDID